MILNILPMGYDFDKILIEDCLSLILFCSVKFCLEKIKFIIGSILYCSNKIDK